MLLVLIPTETRAFSLMPSEMSATEISEWEISPGDSLLVDTNRNIGYLVHENGGYTEFPVATGQRRIVRYIGRTYNAKTPNLRWDVREKVVKGDRTTFGKRGLFLRLFDDDGETAYGIHSHRSIDAMLAEEKRYRSMGCILVSESLLDVIEATYEANGQTLVVVTVDGFEDTSVTYETLRQTLAMR